MRWNWFQNSKFLGQFPCIGFQGEDELLPLSSIFFLLNKKTPTKHNEPTDIHLKQQHFLPTTKKSTQLSQTKQMAPKPWNKMTHTLKVLETWGCLKKILPTLSVWAGELLKKFTLQYYPYQPLSWSRPSSSHPLALSQEEIHIFDLPFQKKGKPILLHILEVG